MENIEKYFGGTGITLDKLKVAYPTINVDGTTYPIERWLKECALFDKLVVNESKVWIPYNVWEQGVVTEVVWDKVEFKHYGFATEETMDWWVSEPYCKVKLKDKEGEYFVYEMTFYKNWKRKTQMAHLTAQREKPKRKFLSAEDIAEFKKQEVIKNSQAKTNN